MRKEGALLPEAVVRWWYKVDALAISDACSLGFDAIYLMEKSYAKFDVKRVSWVFMPFVSAASLASEPEQSAPSGKLVALETAVLQRDLASLGAPIKSERSLQRHLSLGLGESPLRYLSKPALNRFVRSLQFNDNGLTTYRYTELESELTPTQIFQVLALFGQQHQTRFMKGARITTILDQEIMQGDIPGVVPAGFGDCDIPSPTQPLECGGHKNYRCSSPGTCAPSDTLICTENC